VTTITTSADKIAKRGDRIENMDFAKLEGTDELQIAELGKAAE
jgi:hypothetical protein